MVSTIFLAMHTFVLSLFLIFPYEEERETTYWLLSIVWEWNWCDFQCGFCCSNLSTWYTIECNICLHFLQTLTLGEPQTFTVQVTPLRNLPLDLYILIDLSNSMSDELQSVKNITGQISELWCIPAHTHPLVLYT